jgi:hypothetical protein
MKFNRQRLIFGLFVLALITITELVTGYFKLPSWPAYVAWVLFFIEQMNPKKAAPILIGMITAIMLVLLAPLAIGLLAHVMGPEWGRLTYILAAVYAIFAFGEMIPLLLNNYTFMVLTVAGVALATPNPNPYLWLMMGALGGAALIATTLLIAKLLGAPVEHAH